MREITEMQYNYALERIENLLPLVNESVHFPALMLGL